MEERRHLLDPEVALVAYTGPTSGQDELTYDWLDWLDQHRALGDPSQRRSTRKAGQVVLSHWDGPASLVILTLDDLAEASQDYRERHASAI